MVEQNKFNERADSAIERLKAGIGIPSSKVEVDATGRQVTPPPPGSYAAMEIERQRAAAAANRQPPPVAGEPPTPEPTAAGGESDEAPDAGDQGEPQRAEPEPGSERVKKRFATLAEERRAAERQASEERARREQLEQQLQAEQRKRQELEQERQQLLEQNLDQLDPDTRMRVMMDAHARQSAEATRQAVMKEIAPTINELRAAARHRELSELADRYPSFDMDVHGPLISAFQSRNSACTADQAFRAIAEPEELGAAPRQPRTQAPPVVAPRATRGTSGYVPSNEKPKTGADELKAQREEVAEIGRLQSSQDPVERRRGRDLLDAHLSKRLEGRFPARR